MAFQQLTPSFEEADTRCVRRQRPPLRWLHAAGGLLLLGRCQDRALKHRKGVFARQATQRQKLGQRLLETKVQGWLVPTSSGVSFWKAVRWGGAGFILGWWLKG